jgi:Domain of unknown function (DUF5664)
MARPTNGHHLAQAPDPGMKHDGGKVRVDLLPFGALLEVAKVLTYGARKYDTDNWRQRMKWRRLIGASLRHVLAFCSRRGQ